MRNLKLNKIISLFFASVIVFGLFARLPSAQLPVFAADITAEWTAISDRAGLEAMANDLNGKYYLTADIDLFGAEWTPIGTGAYWNNDILYKLKRKANK